MGWAFNQYRETLLASGSSLAPGICVYNRGRGSLTVQEWPADFRQATHVPAYRASYFTARTVAASMRTFAASLDVFASPSSCVASLASADRRAEPLAFSAPSSA